jgi:hypothetical protein
LTKEHGFARALSTSGLKKGSVWAGSFDDEALPSPRPAKERASDSGASESQPEKAGISFGNAPMRTAHGSSLRIRKKKADHPKEVGPIRLSRAIAGAIAPPVIPPLAGPAQRR